MDYIRFSKSRLSLSSLAYTHMRTVEWQHSRQRLLLPIIILPGYSALNPTESRRAEGLLDTGATSTGIRIDVARQLGLRPKGQRRVNTANGMIIAAEYLVRVGFLCGDYTDPAFDADRQLPYVLEREILGFELLGGFGYEVLIGMDILGSSDLQIRRDGTARLDLE